MSSRDRWYFYNGRVPVPVCLSDGRVFSVRPRGHVYTSVDPRKKYPGKFRPCAKPGNGDEILASLSIKQHEPAPTLEKMLEKPGEHRKAVQELGRAPKGASAPEPAQAPPKVEKKPDAGGTADGTAEKPGKKPSRPRRTIKKDAPAKAEAPDSKAN